MNIQQQLQAKALTPIPDWCTLCGGTPKVTGIFVPRGSACVFFTYCLCERCFKNQCDSAEAVEKIVSFYLGGNNHG